MLTPPLLESFNSVTVLRPELEDNITKYSTVPEYRKEHFILKTGMISNHTYGF
jgi:hypothetical protein